MALSKGHTFTSGEVVTPTKLNNLVDNATIGDGTITTAMIADDAVTADKIATGAVTSDALASGVGGASAINDLTDVDTSSVAPTDGQALVWDNANSQWEPGTVSGGSSSVSSYSSGWFNNTSGLANGGTYSFTHGLGTEDLIIAIWVADDSSGTNKQVIFSDTGDSSAGSKVDGAVVSDASSTTLEVQLGANGGFSVSSTGNWSSFNWSTKYFKVVAIG